MSNDICLLAIRQELERGQLAERLEQLEDVAQRARQLEDEKAKAPPGIQEGAGPEQNEAGGRADE